MFAPTYMASCPFLPSSRPVQNCMVNEDLFYRDLCAMMLESDIIQYRIGIPQIRVQLDYLRDKLWGA